MTRDEPSSVRVRDPDPTAGREFARRMLGGLSWTAGAQVASQVVTFVAGIVLARLLVPSDFGLVGMALAYIGFLWLLGQVGFNSAVIYSETVTDLDLDTIYWTGLVIQALLFGLALLLAPWAAIFFKDPRVVPVVRVASAGLLITGLTGLHKTLLEKRLDFRRLARNQLVGAAVYGCVSVAMALLGYGVWALVAGRLIGDLTDGVLTAISARWRPGPGFSRESLSRLFGYGSRVWMGNLLYYGQENIDNLVVGRVLGTAALGYYSFAFRLANVPRYLFAGVVARVMFPSFSSGRDDPTVLRRVFLRIVSYSVLIALGSCVGLALVAPEFVLVVYGAKWLPAITTLRVLSVAAGLYCVAQVSGPVLLASGKPGLHTRLAAVSTALLLVGALLGVRFGIAGVALGILLSVTVALVLGQYYAARILQVETRQYGRAIMGPGLAIACMVLAVSAWRWLGGVVGVSDTLWLALAIGIGAAALIGGIAASDRSMLSDAVRLTGGRGRVGGRGMRLGPLSYSWSARGHEGARTHFDIGEG